LLKKNLTRGNLKLLTRIRNIYGPNTEKIQSFKNLTRVAKRFYKQGLLEGYIVTNLAELKKKEEKEKVE